MNLHVEQHPLLDLCAFETIFPETLGTIGRVDDVTKWFDVAAPAPLDSSDHIRTTVRDLLRHGGFKPTGRSKPASEYLIKAASGGILTSINLAVDACNAVSLHSGLPISVVDLDLAKGPLRVRCAAAGSQYQFNLSGQTIDLGGLLCLYDGQGPCASPVKDSQRTKTGDSTRRTLSLIWGTSQLPGWTNQAKCWYQEILRSRQADVTDCSLTTTPPEER